MTDYLKGAKGSWIWLVIRMYVGYQWLHAGWGKLTGDKPFDASGYLKGAIGKIFPTAAGAKPLTASWWGTFLQDAALPNVKVFSFMVAWGEFLVGLALILGFATLFAAAMGILMNFSFLMSGSTSSNPYMLVLQFVMLAYGGAYLGYLGVDYYFRPWFRNLVGGLGKEGKARTVA